MSFNSIMAAIKAKLQPGRSTKTLSNAAQTAAPNTAKTPPAKFRRKEES
jgi:hypothetical protein